MPSHPRPQSHLHPKPLLSSAATLAARRIPCLRRLIPAAGATCLHHRSSAAVCHSAAATRAWRHGLLSVLPARHRTGGEGAHRPRAALRRRRGRDASTKGPRPCNRSADETSSTQETSRQGRAGERKQRLHETSPPPAARQ
uniref:Uncharacterized protein n=1 Tax=Arundo donax TaxID=35708 RepID=A0A0A9GVL3_ARUDO